VRSSFQLSVYNECVFGAQVIGLNFLIGVLLITESNRNV